VSPRRGRTGPVQKWAAGVGRLRRWRRLSASFANSAAASSYCRRSTRRRYEDRETAPARPVVVAHSWRGVVRSRSSRLKGRLVHRAGEDGVNLEAIETAHDQQRRALSESGIAEAACSGRQVLVFALVPQAKWPRFHIRPSAPPRSRGALLERVGVAVGRRLSALAGRVPRKCEVRLRCGAFGERGTSPTCRRRQGIQASTGCTQCEYGSSSAAALGTGLTSCDWCEVTTPPRLAPHLKPGGWMEGARSPITSCRRARWKASRSSGP